MARIVGGVVGGVVGVLPPLLVNLCTSAGILSPDDSTFASGIALLAGIVLAGVIAGTLGGRRGRGAGGGALAGLVALALDAVVVAGVLGAAHRLADASGLVLPFVFLAALLLVAALAAGGLAGSRGAPEPSYAPYDAATARRDVPSSPRIPLNAPPSRPLHAAPAPPARSPYPSVPRPDARAAAPRSYSQDDAWGADVRRETERQPSAGQGTPGETTRHRSALGPGGVPLPSRVPPSAQRGNDEW